MVEKYRKIRNKVLFSTIGISVLHGMMYSWSSFSQSMMMQWNWTSKQASLPYTFHTIFFVFSMVIFGKIQDVKGPKVIAKIGSIATGSGLILSGFYRDPLIYLVTIGILVGSGLGMQTVTTAPTAMKWFPPEKKGLISGIVSGGVSISAIIYSSITGYLIKLYGINNTFIYIGIVVLIFTLLLSEQLENPFEEIKNENKIPKNYNKMLKDKNFYKIWFIRAFSDAAGLMLIGHITNISIVQANWEKGFLLMILISIFNALGRIIGGGISDKLGRMNVLKIIFVIQAVNIGLFFRYTTIVTIAIGVATAGFCYGAGIGIFPTIISDLYGQKDFGVNYGILFTAWGVAGAIGPMTAATVFDLTGNYFWAYIIATNLLIIALLISTSFKEKQKLTN